eukprot:2227398-Amphidinium_carterae.2
MKGHEIVHYIPTSSVRLPLRPSAGSLNKNRNTGLNHGLPSKAPFAQWMELNSHAAPRFRLGLFETPTISLEF